METLCTETGRPWKLPGWNDSRGRSEKAQDQTSDMHVSRESDDSIVPEKRANKAATSSSRGGGVRGGKGIDQGKRRTNLTRAGLSAGEAWHGIVGRTRSSEAG